MIKQEYGSDFWVQESLGGQNNIYEAESVYEFLLGRTALDAIIYDMLANSDIRTALLPSYCCHTMIDPFLKRGLKVNFYDVTCDSNNGLNYHIDFESDFDCVLIMQYFGYCNKGYINIIERLHSLNKVIIEDATHSVFCKKPYSQSVDYVFASYRKWMASSGGAIAFRRNEKLLVEGLRTLEAVRSNYLELKENAMLKKAAYFQHNGEKEYLKLFAEAEEIVEKEYEGMQIDEKSRQIIRYTDFEKIVMQRRKNAGILIGKLKRIEGIKLIYNNMNEEDAPLFVPVCVERGKRNALRKYLIEKNIYLPVHWPVSDMHTLTERSRILFDEELSIVCDQRYDEEDMEYIASVIERWTNENA